MRNQELFSVVILLYLNEEYIRYAIDSVLDQDYPSIEVIIVDDHSPEVDLPGIESYVNAHKGANIQRVLVYQNPENFGTVKSINHALKQVEGRYIKLLAADDALYDASVLGQAKQVLDACESGISVSRVMKCSPEMEELTLFRDGFARSLPQRTARETWQALCVHNDIAATGIFFTWDFFAQYGLFDEGYRLLEDWPTWLRVTRLGCRIGYGDFIATKYRANAGSATSVNPLYLADKKRTFETEVRPYRKELGFGRYCKAMLNMKVRDSVLIRKVYGLLFRR